MSKPEKELDYNIVDTALYYGATIKQLKFLLSRKGNEVCERTIQRAIERDKGKTFSDYREEHQGGLKLKLVQKAVEMAISGNCTMLIFCLKNLAGWSDRQIHELSGPDGTPIRHETVEAFLGNQSVVAEVIETSARIDDKS